MLELDVEVWLMGAVLLIQLAATPNHQFIQQLLVGAALELDGPQSPQAWEVTLEPATVGHRQ